MRRGKTIQARQLGRHLRNLRRESGMSVDHAASELSLSVPTIYRYETGVSVPRPPDVAMLCGTYGADAALTDALMALAKEADASGWWRSYNGAIPRWFDTFVASESESNHIRAYDDSRVLGLLQTRQYAEGMIRAMLPSEDHNVVANRVEVRLRRQRILERRNPPQLDVILGEAALMRSPGILDVMAEQLSHLDKMSRRPNISLRILPQDLVHCGLECGSSFTMLAFPKDRRGEGEPPFVYADNLTGAAYLDKPWELEAYGRVWESLVRDAPSPAESRTIINRYRERYEH